ncbi:hypothetical protein HDZ31DRAFT_59482 [Schizophyllum fasciatum]
MIAGLSKAVTLYLAPVLMLTSLLLTLFAYISPVLMLQTRVALMSVTPSTALTGGDGARVDGPSVFMGALGSCARASRDAGVNCTLASLEPVYDTSALPTAAPTVLLSAPAALTPVFIGLSLLLSLVFLLSSTLASFRHKLGAAGGVFERPAVQRVSAWIGVFGFMIGITAFLVVRMWFGKAISDFNTIISTMDDGDAPQLKAAEGNGFTMIWAAYAFYAVPLILALSKLHVASSKA